MIPTERIEQAAIDRCHYPDRLMFKIGFESGVSFAESELKLFAIKLLHYYRHKPFEFTEGKSNEEIFKMFDEERRHND